MFDKISKLPAGLFLVPLLLSALLYTIWPEMVHMALFLTIKRRN
ncbi:2-keto-3-deoxygluconate permease, partial [Jeotgalibaca porci]